MTNVTSKRKISLKVAVENGICDIRTVSKSVQVPVGHVDQLKEFDPYEEMSVEKPTTYAETLLNFVKVNMGTGILALPNAFYHSGYLLGPICMMAVFAMSIYCKHKLLRVNYSLSKKRRVACLPFKDTITAACDEGPPFLQKAGPYLRFLTDVFIVLSQTGSGIVYFTFISSNLKKVCDEYYASVDQQIYLVAIFVPLVLMNYVRSFKYLAPISLITNAVAMVSYGIILYYISTNLHSLAERSAVGKLTHIPLFLGTVFFVYEPAFIVIPMTKEMKKPRHFASRFGVFHVGTATVFVFYFTFGILGYLAYGDESLGSVTLNLPLREVPANIARLSQSAVIFLSHAIQTYVVWEIMWEQWLATKFKDVRWRTAAEYCFRTAVISFEFLLAAAVPNLDLLISLFGALGGPFTGLLVPATLHAAHHWKTTRRRTYLVAEFVAISLIATLVSVVGVVASLASIVQTFQ